ncbi:MerR family transcriptional regulator [Actinomadura sp. NTSP31]|uniref:MerR family transcriptional regulator n=1 Tax=Actinomadura sp. NTSP31 TaxID=1735447 RepID=UPI0035C0551C
MDDLRISQLAERSGVPATTLRFYETAGLLPAGRTPAGYRVYDETAFERLSFIRASKRLGLPLEEIAELLQVWEDGSCAQVRAELRPRLAGRIAEAEQRAAETAGFIATLQGAANHLDALPEREGRCDPQCGPAERVGPVAELAAAEQRCCPFFDFRLHLAEGVVHLEVRAPGDAADLLDELFADPAGSPGKPHCTTDGGCSPCS